MHQLRTQAHPVRLPRRAGTTDHEHLARARGLGLGAASAVGCGALLAARATGWAWAGLAGHDGGSASLGSRVPVDAVVELLAWAGCALALGWLTVLLALAVRQVPPLVRTSGSEDARGSRSLAGRVAAVLVTVTVAAGPASAATTSGTTVVAAAGSLGADSGGPTGVARGDTGGPPAAETVSTTGQEPPPEPGWTPTDRPPPSRTDDVSLVSRGGEPAATVVVQRGDTLWDIAARHLGDAPSPDRVAAEWPRWYAANHDVIGPDPDLILPGQQLVPPSPGGSR